MGHGAGRRHGALGHDDRARFAGADEDGYHRAGLRFPEQHHRGAGHGRARSLPLTLNPKGATRGNQVSLVTMAKPTTLDGHVRVVGKQAVDV